MEKKISLKISTRGFPRELNARVESMVESLNALGSRVILFGDVNLRETVECVWDIQPYTRGAIQVDAPKRQGKQALTMKFEGDRLAVLEFRNCRPYIPKDKFPLPRCFLF